MAGFLPGVPLARRRKIHSHENTLVSSSYNRFVRRTSSASSLPGEAIEARTRLDQKLSCLRLSKNGSVGAEITRTGCSVGRKWWQRGISGKKDFVREEEICAVCLEELKLNEEKRKKKVTSLPCSHRYHSECLLPWLRSHSKCPCCRAFVEK